MHSYNVMLFAFILFYKIDDQRHTGCANKKTIPYRKNVNFSKSSKDLSQTLRICIWSFTQHNLQILSKQQTWFNRYSSLNFKFKFSKWTSSCTHWIFTNSKSNYLHLFSSSSKVSVTNVSCLQLTQYLNRMFRMSISSSKTHRSLLQHDTIALLSMNSCGKSFHIVNKTVFQLGSVSQLWRVSPIAFQHYTPYNNNPLAYQSGSFSVIFKSEYHFNYLFT